MNKAFLDQLREETESLKASGLYKSERLIAGPQQPHLTLKDGSNVLNLCANNYLGLANHPDLILSAKESLSEYGYGMASVRFICGTQTIHHQLEIKLSQFLQTDATILYSSCFDANGGLFETLLGPEDAVISDSLNHASIIDGIRLCKAKRYRYKNNDMDDLRIQLEATKEARFILIATDGVFSMDGIIANLPDICALAKKYNAITMVDDSHAVGFVGPNGAGTPDYYGLQDQIDINTGTLGKALGGASGGYTSGRKEIVEWLRQRSRPYLFSNSLAPPITASTLAALDLITNGAALRNKLSENSLYFRKGLTSLGFNLVPGTHPIIPVMLGDAKLAQQFAADMLEQGVYVVSFSYPVVPQGAARIRTQMSAAHSREDLDHAIAAFKTVGRSLNVIPSGSFS